MKKSFLGGSNGLHPYHNGTPICFNFIPVFGYVKQYHDIGQTALY